MKKILLLAAFLFIFAAFYKSSAQNILPQKWKFSTGDNPEWAKPSFNDQSWKEISPLDAWENQGYAGYDGCGWYRATFVIPSSMKKNAEKYNGFVLHLGKIDDADETFFNGELVGNTGGMPPKNETKWDTPRAYTIPLSKILWDKPNTIAVRVYDSGGGGGIYSAPVDLSFIGLSEKLTITPAFKEADHIIKGIISSIPVNVKSSLLETIKGKMTISIVSDFKKEITKQTIDISISKNATKAFSFPIKDIEPGFYTVTVKIESTLGNKQEMFKFAVEPEKVVSPPDAQPDFENYWMRAKKELAAVAPQYKLIKKDSLCTAKRDVFLVEMRSLGNVLVRGWYSVPKKEGKFPVILQVHGYNSPSQPQYVDYGDDFIGFGLHIRGQGKSCDNVNPGIPGYMQSFINDKEMYIYRGAYMDCVRAVDFLFSRPEIDTTRVVVEGASQGGALTFATAALNNTRIKLCVPQVPFLSDFKHYFQVANWPGNEFVNWVEIQKKSTWDQVYNTLSYIDIKNLAQWIKAPMLMSCGLCDDVCPNHINFAAYNLVKSSKEYRAYPYAGHGVPNEFYTYKMEWIRKNLGLK
jgi:cephalosporin-C deacetylase